MLEYDLQMDRDTWSVCLAFSVERKLMIQRAEIDMDYSDAVALSLSTAVLVNFPKPRFAVLPVSLGVELAAIGGTVSWCSPTFLASGQADTYS